MKSCACEWPHWINESLPAWERGLKFDMLKAIMPVYKSLPAWERGLKFLVDYIDCLCNWSLPAWERGLKYKLLICRVPCRRVAPRVGAWIEMVLRHYDAGHDGSRSPRGSVD